MPKHIFNFFSWMIMHYSKKGKGPDPYLPTDENPIQNKTDWIGAQRHYTKRPTRTVVGHRINKSTVNRREQNPKLQI